MRRVLAVVSLCMIIVSACGTWNLVPLPQTKPDSAFPAALGVYTLANVVIADKEACALDAEGNLIVFAESAYAYKDGSAILVGEVTVKLGERFGGSLSSNIPGGMKCGGKTYPAYRLIGDGIISQENFPGR